MFASTNGDDALTFDVLQLLFALSYGSLIRTAVPSVNSNLHSIFQRRAQYIFPCYMIFF